VRRVELEIEIASIISAEDVADCPSRFAQRPGLLRIDSALGQTDTPVREVVSESRLDTRMVSYESRLARRSDIHSHRRGSVGYGVPNLSVAGPRLAVEDAMKAKIHFSCDPDFYALALSYEDRDRWEGDLHVMCGGQCDPGVPCECFCHSPKGEAIYGEQRRAVRAWKEKNARTLEAGGWQPPVRPSKEERRRKWGEGLAKGLDRYGRDCIRFANAFRRLGELDAEIRTLDDAVQFFGEHRATIAEAALASDLRSGEEPAAVIAAWLTRFDERLADVNSLAEAGAYPPIWSPGNSWGSVPT